MTIPTPSYITNINEAIGYDFVSESFEQGFYKDQLQKGRSLISKKEHFLVPRDFVFGEWIQQQGAEIYFQPPGEEAELGLLRYEDYLVIVKVDNRIITVRYQGSPVSYQVALAKFTTGLERAGCLVEWVYDPHGNSIIMPLSSKPLINSAYPWISEGVENYFKRYIEDDANILVLLGPPGTGKTSFIRSLLTYSQKKAKISYSEEVMANDYFFANFMSSDALFLVQEDADTFLKPRAEGNTMMHKFLNVGDGLISTKGKKLIFSTNLRNVSDIDSALVRPGRCFDVLKFHPLTRVEAEAVKAEMGSTTELPPGEKLTLAEVVNGLGSPNVKISSVGFFNRG